MLDRLGTLLPRTVGARLVLTVTVVVAVVVALAGLVVVVRVDRGEREAADQTLATRASEVNAAATKSGSLPTDGTYVVRVLAGGRVNEQKGATVRFSVPIGDGYSTVTAEDGSHWRSLVQTLKSGAQLQILISLTEAERRHAGNVRTVNLAVILAALLAAAAARLAAEPALRRLNQKTPDTSDISGETADSVEVAEPPAPTATPPHISDISGMPSEPAVPPAPASSPAPAAPPADARTDISGVTPMSDSAAPAVSGAPSVKPDEAEESDRLLVELFRGPVAALGDGLETLLDNPDMSSTQRHLVLAAVQTEHRRLLELLEALQEPERHA